MLLHPSRQSFGVGVKVFDGALGHTRGFSRTCHRRRDALDEACVEWLGNDIVHAKGQIQTGVSGLHFGSHFQLREWPSSHWSSLAKELAKLNVNVVISGSAADELKANQLAQEINLGDKVTVIAGKTSIAEFSNILLHAQACISVNTGVAHLAGSLNVPTVALNGPTNADRWGIQGENAVNLNVPKAQGGAFLSLGFEYPQNPNYIMNQISVDSVLDSLNALDVLG